MTRRMGVTGLTAESPRGLAGSVCCHSGSGGDGEAECSETA
jgi:hypothetical protein